jgi:threonine aldolase
MNTCMNSPSNRLCRLHVAGYYLVMATMHAVAVLGGTNALSAAAPLRLQVPHPALSPKETLERLADQCEELGIDEWDVYGDFHKTAAESFLREFEAEVAQEFQKEDAVFVPSGVMAQEISLLIHSRKKEAKGDGTATMRRFLCHATSHLLLHEQDGFRELCDMEAVSLPQHEPGTGLGAPPLLYDHVYDCLETHGNDDVSAILLELPHRELGGKITPWDDIIKMQQLASSKGLAFHCDGARIFEATTGYEKSVAEMAEPFDSVYISFYKGLGGLSGAMLLGSKEFCEEARVWLRRFGGNLYTLLPYVVSGWNGYRRNWIQPNKSSEQENTALSFQEKKDKLLRLVEAFSSNQALSQVLTLEPAVPQVPMVHCYLRSTVSQSEMIRDRVETESGVSIFHRLRPIDDAEPEFQKGYRCKFELSIGEANGSVPDETWIKAWDEFGRDAQRCI